MNHGYYDLGPHSRIVVTSASDAQTWFDRGLNWTFGFNHDEAKRCFERAIAADPRCAMAHWGLAYAYGPHLNKDWRFYSADELADDLPLMHESARRAAELSADGDPAEHALAGALCERYPLAAAGPIEEMVTWHDAYADAMREVYEDMPNDHDVVSLFVEAMMMRTPWRLWSLDSGEVTPGASTPEMLTVLELAGATTSPVTTGHPGVLHMAIHTLEMSPTPEHGLGAADALRNIVPDAGHLQHMPSHIDALCGRYEEAVEANERAVAADMKYLADIGTYGQYTTDVCHDNHMLMYAAMQMGRWKPSVAAADRIWSLARPDVMDASTPAFAIKLDGYTSMRMHAFVRFGKWREIVEQEPSDDHDRYPVTIAMHHYATAVAWASLGEHDRAVRAASDFEDAVDRVTSDRFLFNNDASIVLDVARSMMAGEISYHAGDHTTGFDHLREAVEASDRLFYTEPWAWMHPPRHALGALLLEQGEVEEAEEVYRVDLGLAPGTPRANVHPNNVWALHGLVECLSRRGAHAELDRWRPELDAAIARTDSPITSSCACRPSA